MDEVVKTRKMRGAGTESRRTGSFILETAPSTSRVETFASASANHPNGKKLPRRSMECLTGFTRRDIAESERGLKTRRRQGTPKSIGDRVPRLDTAARLSAR